LFNPQIIDNNFITDNVNWTMIEGSFISDGTEEYLTIGYFKDNNSNDTLKLINRHDSLTPATSFSNYAYYYVDDISIVPLETVTDLPNVFTPNGDGINDLFYFDKESIKPKLLTIINRWGLKVFESLNNFFWDGRTISGEPCNAGTYYYIIQTETETYKGFLELIR
jgi:gliding motility-associated-like protein